MCLTIGVSSRETWEPDQGATHFPRLGVSVTPHTYTHIYSPHIYLGAIWTCRGVVEPIIAESTACMATRRGLASIKHPLR
jgi:hypothetical protein